MPKTISYLRVSSPQQDTEKNKADILKFANDRKFGHIEFIEEKSRVRNLGRNGRSRGSSTTLVKVID